MKFSTSIVLWFTLLLTHSLNAKIFEAQYQDKTSSEIEAENVLFLAHATKYWDPREATETATLKTLQFAKDNNYYKIATITAGQIDHPQLAPMYFFRQPDIDSIIESQSGTHRITFRGLKKILFVGGNVNRCMCESLRDVAIELYKKDLLNNIDFYIVTDASFATYNDYSPITEVSVAEQFATTFFVPAFNCPSQNWGRAIERRTAMPEVNMSVYFRGDFIGKYNLEKKDTNECKDCNQINMHFITSNDLHLLK